MQKLRFLLFISFVLLTTFSGFAQKYLYKVDLNNIEDDKVKVELKPAGIKFTGDTLIYVFPKTVPGTYAAIDYGRFIEDFEAFNTEGAKLKVHKKGNNLFYIYKAKSLEKLKYWVNDTWDDKDKKNKVFEPAGTMIEADKGFIINGGAFFGYFKGYENYTSEVMIDKPKSMHAVSGMKNWDNLKWQKFNGENYAHLVDNPIMVSNIDTAMIRMGKTTITISCLHESGKKIAHDVVKEIKPSMDAIEKFIDVLPVKNYNFLIYVKDYSKIGYNPQDVGTQSNHKISKVVKKISSEGFGALEHNNSSLYYFPDFGNNDYIPMIEDYCIHEFMHIITPLNLHTEPIGNFNFENPIMSKHLWLYEGVTEYFASIIELKGGLITLNKYLNNVLAQKIAQGEEFPYSKMSFTEMSSNVLDKPYKQQYGQVYERGAVLAAMLDLEIMHLTNGKKTLKDVVFKLISRYGKKISAPEDSLISIFINEVHPDLKNFFTDHIEGKKDIDYSKYLNYAGITYVKNDSISGPLNPTLKNDMVTKATANIFEMQVTSVGLNEWAGFKVNDIYNVNTSVSGIFNPDATLKQPNENGIISVLRNNQKEIINYVIRYGKIKLNNVFINNAKKTEEQKVIFEKWINY